MKNADQRYNFFLIGSFIILIILLLFTYKNPFEHKPPMVRIFKNNAYGIETLFPADWDNVPISAVKPLGIGFFQNKNSDSVPQYRQFEFPVVLYVSFISDEAEYEIEPYLYENQFEKNIGGRKILIHENYYAKDDSDRDLALFIENNHAVRIIYQKQYKETAKKMIENFRFKPKTAFDARELLEKEDSVIINSIFKSRAEMTEKNSDTDERAQFLYVTRRELKLYDSISQEKRTIANGDIKNFDFSQKFNLVAYTVNETHDSNIFLKDLSTNETVRITSVDNISSSNPRISPTGESIFYINKYLNFNNEYEEEIVQKQISKPLEEVAKAIKPSIPVYNLDKSVHCIEIEKKDDPKIGIDKILTNDEIIIYWQKDWGAQCSGLKKYKKFVYANGTELFKTWFLHKNSFIKNNTYRINWVVENVYSTSTGTFLIYNTTEFPLSESAAYFYNSSWDDTSKTLFDTTKKNYGDVKIAIEDIKFVNDQVKVVYSLSKYNNGTNYYYKEISIGNELDINFESNDNLIFHELPVVSGQFPFPTTIDSVKILGNGRFVALGQSVHTINRFQVFDDQKKEMQTIEDGLIDHVSFQ